MSLAGTDAQIYTTGTSTSMSQESCDAVDSADPSLIWQVTDHSKDVFDPSVSFTVEVNPDVSGGGSWSTASTSNYTLRYLVGVVEFDSNPFGGTHPDEGVRVTGSYLPKYSLLEGFEQNMDFDRELYETTNFQDDGVRRGEEGPLDITGDFSLNKIIERELDSDGGTEPTLREILLGSETHGGSGSINQERVYRCQPNDSGDDVLEAAWVKFATESLDNAVGSKQERTYSFEAANQDAAMASQTAKVGDIFAASEI